MGLVVVEVEPGGETARQPEQSTRVDRALVAALTGNFLLRVGNAATGIMLTLFLTFIDRTEFQVTPLTVGLFSTVFYVSELLLAPLFGAQSDRRGLKMFLILGPLLGLVAVELTAVAPLLAASPLHFLFDNLKWIMPTILWVLLSTRLIEGLSSAASIPAILSYLSARTDHDRALRGWVMGLFEATTALSVLGGQVLGTLLWGAFNAWAFAMLGVIYLASLASFFIVPEYRRLGPVPDLHHSAMNLLRQPAIWKFVPAWLAVNAVAGLWNTHGIYQLGKATAAGQYLVGRFAGDTIGLAVTLASYAILFAIGSLAWGRAFGRWSEPFVMRVTLIGLFMSAGAAWAINHSGNSEVVRGIALAIFAAGVIVQSGFLPAAVGYLARLSSLIAADRGLFMGLYSVMLGAGALIGGAVGAPFVGGNIPFVPGGFDGVIVLTLVMGVLSLFVVVALGDGEPGHPDTATERPVEGATRAA